MSEGQWKHSIAPKAPSFAEAGSLVIANISGAHKAGFLAVLEAAF